MNKLQAAIYLIFAYSICSLLLCGDLISPLDDADHYTRPGKRCLDAFFVGSLIAAAIMAPPFITPFIWLEFRPEPFITAWMLLAAISAGIYGTSKRTEATAAFHVDKVAQSSFFTSLHQARAIFSSIFTQLF
jgi:hypothetical protein